MLPPRLGRFAGYLNPLLFRELFGAGLTAFTSSDLQSYKPPVFLLVVF